MRLFFSFGVPFLFLCACAGAGAFYFVCTMQWIDVSVLEQYNPGKPTILLDDAGNEWGRFERERRDPIAYSEMPSHLIEAFLAAEDWYFFSHCGLSWKGIVRSIWVNICQGKRVQGASTITQQLVKLLFFDTHKTFTRKLKEQLYALIIEQQFTKEQILEIYLNHVYFGCGLYGIQAAAHAFWHTSAADLSIAQAATLAGIIRAPNHYCPFLDETASVQRRNVILQAMRARNVIMSEQYEVARNTPLSVDERCKQTCAPHVKEYIRHFLEQLVGKEELYTGGLIVQTTLNQTMQNTAEALFNKHIMQLRSTLGKPIDGGFLVSEGVSGALKAVVGGVNSHSLFNRAFHAKRQLGSIFKPLIYAAALEQGLSFADVVIDEPIVVFQEGRSWSPHNYNHRFEGAMTRAYALSHSNNMAAIKTLQETGIENVISLAQRCRLSGPLHPYPSLALGCIEATLLEASAVIALFANGGIYVEPYLVAWVKDSTGKKIYAAHPHRERVLPARIAHQVAHVLQKGIQRLKSSGAYEWFEGDALSKTGTTNDSRTCWYIGATPSFTTAVYVGCDDNQSMGKNIYPLQTAFPLWLAFNREIKVPASFRYDPSLQTVWVDEKKGRRISRDKKGAIDLLI